MPFFINADLEVTSDEDLSCFLDEWGDAVVEMHCGRLDEDSFFASFEINSEPVESDQGERNDPELLMNQFCDLVSALSPKSKRIWDSASRRVIDLGYQSDEGGSSVRSIFTLGMMKRISGLGIELALTFYPLEGKIGSS